MKELNLQKPLINFFEEKLNFQAKTLSFRFPIETLDTLLKSFFKEYEENTFLVQSNNKISNLSLKKISKSFLLQVPVNNGSNEHLYIGLSDRFSFLILFDEPDSEFQNIKEQNSKFFLTFDPFVIDSIFNHFYKNYCKFLSLKEKKLLIKLKNATNRNYDIFSIGKFQEVLLINTLNEYNKLKQAKILEAISFTDELILITDLAGNIKEVNKNFENFFLLNLKKSNIRKLLPEDKVEAAFEETMSKSKWQEELQVFNEISKKEDLLLVSCYLFKDELKRPHGFVFTFKDITNLRKLDYINKKLIEKLRERNIQLTEVNRRLLEADRIKNDLLSVVSHELKTPLSTIIGFCELIENRKYDENEIKNFVDEIFTSAKHLDRLISDYLDVATNQFGATKDKLCTMPVNLADLIKLSFEAQKAKFKEANFNFYIDCLGYEPIIISEKENIKKLFDNLLNNSMKYSPNGGKINVKILNDSEKITVSISDEGIGVTLEDTKHLFEPFYRADNSLTRNFSGIGLGLAVCKKIVEIYDGSIWCEPGVDLGSVFYVTLPVNPHKAREQRSEIRDQKTEKEKAEFKD